MTDKEGKKKQSTGDEPVFVDGRYNRLMVELNLSKAGAKYNGLQLREWSYT